MQTLSSWLKVRQALLTIVSVSLWNITGLWSLKWLPGSVSALAFLFLLNISICLIPLPWALRPVPLHPNIVFLSSSSSSFCLSVSIFPFLLISLLIDSLILHIFLLHLVPPPLTFHSLWLGPCVCTDRYSVYTHWSTHNFSARLSLFSSSVGENKGNTGLRLSSDSESSQSLISATLPYYCIFISAIFPFRFWSWLSFFL